MKITIKAFSDFKNFLPRDTPSTGWVVDMADGATIDDLLALLKLPVDTPKVFTVNDTNEKADYVLNDNDFLKIFPMAMGG